MSFLWVVWVSSQLPKHAGKWIVSLAVRVNEIANTALKLTGIK